MKKQFFFLDAVQKRPCKYGEIDTCAIPATCDNPNPEPIVNILK